MSLGYLLNLEQFTQTSNQKKTEIGCKLNKFEVLFLPNLSKFLAMGPWCFFVQICLYHNFSFCGASVLLNYLSARHIFLRGFIKKNKIWRFGCCIWVTNFSLKGAITLKPPVIFGITQKQHHWMTHQPKLGLVVPAIW